MKNLLFTFVFLLGIYASPNVPNSISFNQINYLSVDEIIPIQTTHCDDLYNWMVGLALMSLEDELNSIPNGAPEIFEDWVWENFDYNLATASGAQSACVQSTMP